MFVTYKRYSNLEAIQCIITTLTLNLKRLENMRFTKANAHMEPTSGIAWTLAGKRMMSQL